MRIRRTLSIAGYLISFMAGEKTRKQSEFLDHAVRSKDKLILMDHPTELKGQGKRTAEDDEVFTFSLIRLIENLEDRNGDL